MPELVCVHDYSHSTATLVETPFSLPSKKANLGRLAEEPSATLGGARKISGRKVLVFPSIRYYDRDEVVGPAEVITGSRVVGFHVKRKHHWTNFNNLATLNFENIWTYPDASSSTNLREILGHLDVWSSVHAWSLEERYSPLLSKHLGLAITQEFSYTSILENLLKIRHRDKVSKFLEAEVYLSNMLIEATRYISKFFSGPEFILDWQYDPDSDQKEEFLVLYILTNLKPREALEKKDEFNEDWWFRNKTRANGNLIITLAYK
jgi:hypothetical protein